MQGNNILLSMSGTITTAADGKKYNVAYYALEMILAVGFRVRGVRGTQFRQWANAHLSEYLVKGFTMDDERLKNPDGRPDYFDELLARIRDIRASEKRFYQKVPDLFALSSDYRGNEAQTNQFFAEVQNKLLYAATGHTAAELVVGRSDPDKPNMGLTSWKGGIVRKEDVIVAKNYLTADEIDTLNRITVLFLEAAELRVKRRMDLTLPFWIESVDKLLSANLFDVLQGAELCQSRRSTGNRRRKIRRIRLLAPERRGTPRRRGRPGRTPPPRRNGEEPPQRPEMSSPSPCLPPSVLSVLTRRRQNGIQRSIQENDEKSNRSSKWTMN